MAWVLGAKGSIDWYADARVALTDFTQVQSVEWLTLKNEPLDPGATPWSHPNLEIPHLDREEFDPEHSDIEQWRLFTLAVVNENAIEEQLPASCWVPGLRGAILVYQACVCSWDGVQYKCEGPVDFQECVRLLRARFGLDAL